MLDITQPLDDLNWLSEIRERLLYLSKNRLWGEMKNEPISFKLNGEPLSLFNDDIWDFSPYKVGTEHTILNFNFNKKNIPENLIQEIKLIALAYLYYSRYAYRINSINSKINCLKRLTVSLFNYGVFTFDGLNIDVLKTITKKNLYVPRELDMGPINSLNDLSEFLPFQVDFNERLTLRKLRASQPLREQHPVIPLRIYLSALNTFTNEIKYWYKYKQDLEKTIQEVFEYERKQFVRIIKSLRHGKSNVEQVFYSSDPKYHKFLLELKKHNIPLVDYEDYKKWDELFNKLEPNVRTDYFKPFPIKKIGNMNFESHHDIKRFCRVIDSKCRYLVLCLSGMRSNELLQITPEFGAQVITLDGIDIHLFHTKQQKITSGYQGENDVYVTTHTGHLAYELLNVLNRPVRKWYEEQGQKGWFLNTYSNFRKPCSVHSSTRILASMRDLFSKISHSFSVELNSDDLDMLNRSDPEKSFSIGDKWHLTPHQLRRSLAYYLVGMQLADYPQLKQQLSHYSIAMTIYYARNASSFRKMYHDLEKEKFRQEARKYSCLLSKVQSGVRLGGGQGKKLFSESFSERDMSPEYFEKEIRAGRKHIHAIAPGMYCINRMCGMRIGIDLSECTDCDWSVIESSAYVSAARQESINILEKLAVKGELSPDIFLFHSKRIRASEKIMADLELEFKPYLFLHQ